MTTARFVCVAFALFGVVHTPAFADPIELPGTGTKLEKVDFEKHVMGLLGRLGCASGSCHGSFQGKGGLRLSLFGYDPEKDLLALTRDVNARRTNPLDPDKSLILAKPTGQIAHGGGKRLSKNSWQYHVLREWIADGAKWSKGSGEVSSITITPPEQAFTKAGESAQIKVEAAFVDGSREDITPFCDFRVNDDAIAEVSTLGLVKAIRPGDTALVVSYRGHVLPVRLLVPVDRKEGAKYPEVAEVNFVDREVFAKLKRLNVVPSDLCDDAEFLRRVTIDTIGCLPTPEEVRAFLASDAADKRAKKIDELLAHPMHAALWATKFCDITGNNTDALEQPREKRSHQWYTWFRKRLADNMPYDQLVKGILTATSREGKSPEDWVKSTKEIDQAARLGFDSTYADRETLDLFWRRQQANVPIEQWGEKTAAAFMGIRLECAQCHKHPFDRWTQTDYRQHANVFGQIRAAVSPEAKQAVDAENAERKKNPPMKGQQPLPNIRELFLAPGKPNALPHPETGAAIEPRALGGPTIKLEDGKDARAAFFDWLRSRDNPYFARSFANRVWGHYFGVGIVDPVDDFALANPPSNPKLLDALAKEFLDHDFDIRHLERVVLNSRTYQLSSKTNETNRLDRTNYSHSLIRPMLAEVVVDVLNSALGTTEDFGKDAPEGSRAIEVGSTRIQNGNPAYLLRIFGRSARSMACDCERSMEPALPRTLFLMTDPILQGKIEKGRLAKLLESDKSDTEIFEELFLATLSRLPRDEEKKAFAQYVERKKDRKALFADTVWALINTREFILNH